jgi:hypothetical protein
MLDTFVAVKKKLKIARWHLRRAAVARQYGADALASMPVVLGNAIPKSGSHLLIQVLLGLTKMGPFVDPGFPPVNRDEANRKFSRTEIVENIKMMKSGDIGYGYLNYSPEYIELLTAPGMAAVFIYRDPRDVVVSEMKYAADIQTNHDLHEYFNHELESDEDRLNFVIKGSKTPPLFYTGVKKRFTNYSQWLQQPVLSLRFEDIVLKRREAFDKLLDYLADHGFSPSISRDEAVQILIDSIEPQKSGTFRKGKPGGWKDVFTEKNKALFKQEAGDILIRLGYENDMDW